MADTVYEQLSKYWQERSASTRIPADVYTSVVNREYLAYHIRLEIKNGFAELKGAGKSENEYRNTNLDKSISDFYNAYAAENGFTDNEVLDKAIKDTQDSAYSVIQNNCDIYKFRTLSQHNILSKAAKVFNYRFKLLIAALTGTFLLILLLYLIDHKEKSAVLYWCGCSGLIAGILGALPCLYLMFTDYFSSFSIKQAQVFKAYTGTMNMVTEAFLAVSVAVFTTGIALLIVYGVVTSRDSSVSPTKLDK